MNDETNAAATMTDDEKKAKRKRQIDEALKRAQEKVAEKKAAGTTSTTDEKPAKEKRARVEKTEKPPREKKAREPKGPAQRALPEVTEAASSIVTFINEKNLAPADLISLAAWINATVKNAAAASTTSFTFKKGDVVMIDSPEPQAQKYNGMLARAVDVRNTRCFLDVLDSNGKVVKEKLYLYTSGVKEAQGAFVPSDQPAADSNEGDDEAEATDPEQVLEDTSDDAADVNDPESDEQEREQAEGTEQSEAEQAA